MHLPELVSDLAVILLTGGIITVIFKKLNLPLVLGYILALLMHLSHIVEKIAFPYLMIIQMIPILGMAPIVLSITGDISSARIIIAAILTFYPVSTNTLAGFKSVGRERHELMRSYGASKFLLYTKMLIIQIVMGKW